MVRPHNAPEPPAPPARAGDESRRGPNALYCYAKVNGITSEDHKVKVIDAASTMALNCNDNDDIHHGLAWVLSKAEEVGVSFCVSDLNIMFRHVIEVRRLKACDLLNKPVSIFGCDLLGQTLLHFACKTNNLSLVFAIMFINGPGPAVDLEVRDNQGNTPLHLCSDTDIMNYLHRVRGASGDIRNNAGEKAVAGSFIDNVGKPGFRYVLPSLEAAERFMARGPLLTTIWAPNHSGTTLVPFHPLVRLPLDAIPN